MPVYNFNSTIDLIEITDNENHITTIQQLIKQ